MKAKQADTKNLTSQDVRERLAEALKLDLVGPWVGHEFVEEQLPGRVRPSTWYLTGFLIPSGMPPEKSTDIDEDEDLDEVPASAGLPEESNEERKAAKKGYLPSSMGLSFLVSKNTKSLEVKVRWADYIQTEAKDEEENTISVWQRQPHEEVVEVILIGSQAPTIYNVPESHGLQLDIVERRIVTEELGGQIPEGCRSISVFLVNHRDPDVDNPDRSFAFQSEIEVCSESPFVPRPDLSGINAQEWDEQVSDLHYADVPEYATGHGISAEWEIMEGACFKLHTAWMPSAEVEKTQTADILQVALSMDVLGALPDGKAAKDALQPLVNQYRDWINAQQITIQSLDGNRRETAGQLLNIAGITADRIERGIVILTEDADVLDAFRMANRAVARALHQRLRKENFCWRAFQLAFILLNLPGLANDNDPHRETVDLLFFPTGGGKTEAYLGLAAFAMVLRRLRHPEDKGLAGAGVSVIMRYTLRLLTLDQLSRAAGLVCAMELEREKNIERYGSWPFEIGLWVGKAATPNFLGHKGDGQSDTARIKVRQYKANPRYKPSPIPLENCPWCGKRFEPNSFSLLPNDDAPLELRIICTNFECDFTRNRPLPIVAVDEPVYHRLPGFLIATADKFASLPWVGQSGVLLGGADRYDANGFYGGAEPGKGNRLAKPLLPPDLIIQDELHLISGPLGTMAGLYETVIEALCTRENAGKVMRPKIIASTATVRRAQDQIQSLFARASTQIFPPPGPNYRDSFFANIAPLSKVPGRLYLGIAAQGRNPKVVMRKVLVPLMAAAEQLFLEAGGKKNQNNPADPYMTVLGYFNSLKELGGARRILEEEVQNTIKGYGSRKRINDHSDLYRDRKTFTEVVELTSRVSTDKVAEARRRLEAPFLDPQHIDCAIATNMISVGLDIPRLGLMLVLGQPKSHAEYIQATSRIGRDEDKPGLVITLLNVHKPRDRSHYERFRHYHETFYRTVEVGSVTPFSARALDHGFAGALISLARHSFPELTPPRGVEHIVQVRAVLERRLIDVFFERVNHQQFTTEDERQERMRSIQNRIVDLLDSWLKIFEDYNAAGVALQYQRYETTQPRPLLRDILEKDFESVHHKKFRVNRSLRDVEPDVNLYLRELNGKDIEPEEIE